MNRRQTIALALLGVAAIAGFMLRLFVSSDGIGLAPTPETAEIRLLVALAGVVVGASLAVSGVLLQSLLRNPLGEPWMLGLTAGSSLAIAIWTFVGYLTTGLVAKYTTPFAPPLIGAIAALGIVYLLAQRRGFLEPLTLVLVGVIVSVICAALTSLVQAMLPDAGLALGVRWMLGAISENTPTSHLLIAGVVAIVGIIVAAILGPALDAAALGDDEARSVGVRLGALRFTLFLTASVLAAATMTLAGPIGFVGLICPHLARAWLGARHRILILGSALAGVAMLCLADALVTVLPAAAKSLFGQPISRLPVGVVTALIGGPLFIWLLRRRPVEAGGAC